MKRVISRSLWAVAGLFVLYMLLFRVFAGVVQLMPNQATQIVQQLFAIEVQFDTMDVRQSWTGIDIHAQNLRIKTDNWHANVTNLAIDFQLLAPFWPSLAYGEQLQVSQAEFVVYSSNNSVANDWDTDDVLALLSKLWHRVEVTDVRIQGATTSINAFYIDSFNASRAERWSILADVSVNHLDDHPSTSFQISARLDEDQFGLLSEGEVVVRQKQPFELAGLADFFPNADLMLERIPQGSLSLNAQAIINKRKLRQLSFDLSLDQLVWKADDLSLPRSVSAMLDWHGGVSTQDSGEQMSMTLTNLRFNHQPVKSFSPVRLTLDDQVLSLSLKQASLLPYQSALHHMFGDAVQALQRIDVRDISLKFDLRSFSLLKLNLALDALDWQGEQFQLSASNIRLIKELDSLKVQFDEPIMARTDLTQQQDYILDMGSEWFFELSEDEKIWSLAKHQAWLNDIPIELLAFGDSDGLLNVQLGLKASKLEQVKTQLLPYEIMSSHLKTWLQTALVYGDQIEASAEFHGSWKDFDVVNKQPKFEVNALIHNTVLKFNPRWPTLEGFTAKLAFTPFDLSIHADQAQLFGAKLENITAQINQLDQTGAVLQLSGRVVTQAQNGLNFLMASPLAETLGLEYAIKQTLKADGNWIIGLDKIVIPLSNTDQKTQVTGFVDFNNGQLRLFDQVTLSKLDGRLNFSEQGVWAKNLTAQAFNGVVKASVNSTTETGMIDLTLNGRANLTGGLGFKGKLPWQLNASIPFANKQGSTMRVDLSVEPQALTSDWPYPLATEDLKTTDFKADLFYQDTNLIVKADLANIFHLNSSLHTRGDGVLQLDFAHIQLGEETSKSWKNARGVQFQGRLKQLDMDSILKQASVLSSFTANKAKQSSVLKGVVWHDANLNIDQVTFLKQVYPSIGLTWSSIEPDLSIYLVAEADYLKAFINYDAGTGLDVTVNRLALVLPKTDWMQPDSVLNQCLAPISQQLWPKIRFLGTNISIGQRHLNQLEFQLTDNAKQRDLSDLKFKFANQAGEGKGSYRWDKQSNQSYFALALMSRKVDELSEFAGFKKGFTGNKGQFNLKVNWLGGFECFRLDQLNGLASMRFENGVIEQIEPGFARLLGLLSVDSVLRRLRLDLKDVTDKGLDYEYIKAKAVFKDAKLNLNEFNMKSPGVSVDMQGDILLAQKTFDLKAKVTPALGAALPAVSGLLGLANPVTGVLVYVLAKNLPFINEDIVSYDYKISGPWLEPEVVSSGGSVFFK